MYSRFVLPNQGPEDLLDRTVDDDGSLPAFSPARPQTCLRDGQTREDGALNSHKTVDPTPVSSGVRRERVGRCAA
jgi:hypothetical protein